MRLIPVLLALCLCNAARAAEAEASPQPSPRFELSVRTWFSDGESSSSHDSSEASPLVGNPTSVLVHRGVSSTLLEVGGTVRLPRRFSIRGHAGRGSQDSGLLTDDDFVSAEGAEFYGASTSGAHRFVGTLSDVDDGDVSYYGGELARQVAGKTRDRALELFIAYRRWEEEYEATGVTYVECTIPMFCLPPGSSILEGEPVVTDNYDWEAGLLGIEGHRPLGKKLSLEGRLAYAFRTTVRNEDIHHQRDDLEQDPSFVSTGNGHGLEIAATLAYRVGKRYELTFGYRRWQNSVDSGALVAFPVGEDPVGARLVSVETERDGIVMGFSYRD